MNNTEPNVEKKIIDSAIECIEQYGIQNVTTRKIAEAAGVNTAAINYYFRSKERLLDEAMSTTIENAFEDWESFFSSDDADLIDGLSLVVSTLLYGAQRYPNISRAHLYKPFMGDFDTPFVHRYNSFLDLLFTHVKRKLEHVDDESLKLRIIQFLSSATFPAIFPGFFDHFADTRLTDTDTYAKYLALLNSTLLSEKNNE